MYSVYEHNEGHEEIIESMVDPCRTCLSAGCDHCCHFRLSHRQIKYPCCECGEPGQVYLTKTWTAIYCDDCAEALGVRKEFKMPLYWYCAECGNAFRAEWVDGNHRGNATRNLYIYEKVGGAKRYSITLPEKGAKIQPYFDVPTVANGAHLFKIPSVATRPLVVEETTYQAVAKAAAAAGLGHDGFVRELMATYQATSPKKRGGG